MHEEKSFNHKITRVMIDTLLIVMLLALLVLPISAVGLQRYVPQDARVLGTQQQQQQQPVSVPENDLNAEIQEILEESVIQSTQTTQSTISTGLAGQ